MQVNYILIFLIFTTAPGPADYSVRPLVGFTEHSQNSQKPRAPQWSMGQRIHSKSTLKTPGPSAYDIKSFTRHGKYFPVALSIPKKNTGLSKKFESCKFFAYFTIFFK